MRNPRDFAKPLAPGAPDPLLEIPVTPSRMIHFFDPSNEKMAAKLPGIARTTDILLGNLEDAVAADRKEAAREGLVRIGREADLGETALWTRVNALDSPWVLDDLLTLVGEIGDRLDVIMVPKVEGPWDIHYVDRLLAQLEARHGLARPILVHAILETALGVTNLEEIAAASPRMQGMSFGPADLAASRRMKTTRVGGGHPGYVVLADPAPRTRPRRAPPRSRTSGTTRSRAWSTPARPPGILPFYGPFGDIADEAGCEAQFRAAFLLGCVGAWSLHPRQIEIARRVFSPDPEEVRFAQRVLEAIPDGRGVHMLDGKMQDDATWKQCKVMVGLAEMLAERGPRAARGLRDAEPRAAAQRSRARGVGQRRSGSPMPEPGEYAEAAHVAEAAVVAGAGSARGRPRAVAARAELRRVAVATQRRALGGQRPGSSLHGPT